MHGQLDWVTYCWAYCKIIKWEKWKQKKSPNYWTHGLRYSWMLKITYEKRWKN